MFRHGGLRLYLLKLLDEAPRHGYEVIRLLQDRFLGVYSPSPGTIYPRLARLEEEGLVTHDEVDGKKVYRITDKGREEISARLDDLAELEEEITAVGARHRPRGDRGRQGHGPQPARGAHLGGPGRAPDGRGGPRAGAAARERQGAGQADQGRGQGERPRGPGTRRGSSADGSADTATRPGRRADAQHEEARRARQQRGRRQAGRPRGPGARPRRPQGVGRLGLVAVARLDRLAGAALGARAAAAGPAPQVWTSACSATWSGWPWTSGGNCARPPGTPNPSARTRSATCARSWRTRWPGSRTRSSAGLHRMTTKTGPERDAPADS